MVTNPLNGVEQTQNLNKQAWKNNNNNNREIVENQELDTVPSDAKHCSALKSSTKAKHVIRIVIIPLKSLPTKYATHTLSAEDVRVVLMTVE